MLFSSQAFFHKSNSPFYIHLIAGKLDLRIRYSTDFYSRDGIVPFHVLSFCLKANWSSMHEKRVLFPSETHGSELTSRSETAIGRGRLFPSIHRKRMCSSSAPIYYVLQGRRCHQFHVAWTPLQLNAKMASSGTLTGPVGGARIKQV